MASESIRRKIAALFQMTASAGCTEAEALSAAAKAADLMAEHGLSSNDVLFTQSKAPAKTKGRGRRDILWGALAYFTNTAMIYTDNKACFVGKGPGPEIAAYLFTILNRAIDREITSFKKTPNYQRRSTIKSKRGAVDDFTAAMVIRLQTKLRQLFLKGMSEPARLAAKTARDEMFPSAVIIPPRKKNVARNKIAMAAGLAAGGGVQLVHGMSGQVGQRQLRA